MEPAEYRERPAPADLRPFVACLWTRRDRDGAASHTVLPDGHVDVLVECGGSPRAFVAGAMTIPLHIPAARADIVAVRFKVGAARRFLRTDACELNDAVVPLDALRRDGAALVARVAAAGGPDERFAHVIAYLRGIYAGAEPPATVGAAAARIAAGAGGIDDGVCAALGVTPQSLARTFRQHVGLSPKELSRVLRMQRALPAVRSAEQGLAEIALAFGYSDQSHLTQEFRRLTGSTPHRFRHG